MASVRSLLARVVRLETRGKTPRSPIAIAYGSYDAFEVKVQSDIDAGKLDSVEMPIVLAALRRWQSERQH
jgi:hypothetical protein